jgi:uncharacterized protein
VFRLDGSYVFSASDLSGFLACDHLPALDRAAAAGDLARPQSFRSLAARYGDAHEATYLRRLKTMGMQVAELARPPSLTSADLVQAQRQTVSALAEGYDVVYQGTLFDGEWLGHPDFLVRRDGGSGRWGHAYDIVDTKLARRAKATALLQVALYGEMLTSLQGCEPHELILALGDGSEERFGFGSVTAYLRAIKRRFMTSLQAPSPYPYPVEHCGLCSWDDHCQARRHDDDHLSLIADIRRQQVLRLETAGVETVGAFAAQPVPSEVRIGSSALDRLHRQAREQVRSGEDDALSYSALPPIEGGGLAGLPSPDAGDIFFDMEGFPYAQEGGLEYLFGWVDTDRIFHRHFAEDRSGERWAFEQFMDELAERRRRHPRMHVYHYASYERSALSRLSNRHGIREEEVADLLRAEVLVDLYRVVRQSVVVGAESYSIKYLEPLYGLVRTGDVRNAAESLEMYQEWLDSDPRDDTILERIADYNEIDCRSTLQLRDWLLALRGADTLGDDGGVVADEEPVRTPSAKFTEWLPLAEAATSELLEDVPEDLVEGGAEENGRLVLAQLLKFHQREDNAQWRDFFARMDLSGDELRDDDSVAVAGLRYEGLGAKVRQSQEYVYSFPAQDVGLRPDSRPIDPATGKSPGLLVRLEAINRDFPDRGVLVLMRRATTEVPHPAALVPQGVIDDYVLRRALIHLARGVVANRLDSPLPEWRAARQLLLRNPPRVTGVDPGERLAAAGEHGAEALARIAPLLDGAVLPVQGPPGSGKTYSAVHTIIDAVTKGHRIGVTANSHRVIEHLLTSLAEESAKKESIVRIVHRAGAGAEEIPGIVNVGTNGDVVDLLDRQAVDVIGGTAWLMSCPEMAGRLDLLVIDEAGQVSLANALASMGSATNTILVGDPAQLDQPVQASHPDGTDVSALGYLIDDAAIMPEHLGLFLDQTRRMHPSICHFISEVVYEGKLSGIPGLEHQVVSPLVPQEGVPSGEQLSGAGIRWLPTVHKGNRTSSVEEAGRIAVAVAALLGGTWTDAKDVEHLLGPEDILVVTPYNAHIAALRGCLPKGIQVGTVDKFQGREAPVVFYSMATSSIEDLPRDFEFLFSLSRLNVAISRARALAVLVCSPALLAPRCRTTRQIRLVNALDRLVEFADLSPVHSPAGGDG